ncbi:hypothetical protein ENBRE01_2761 [Enteropsectra breve]|nr:hypothetical protein ENBRE01_2761 [Enteropsectra breve]
MEQSHITTFAMHWKMKLSHMGETLTKSLNLSADEFLRCLETKFASGLRIKNTAQKFIQASIPESIEEYFSMMRDAAYPSQHNYLFVTAIVDKVIIRSPPELRTILWQVAGDKITFTNYHRLLKKFYH